MAYITEPNLIIKVIYVQAMGVWEAECNQTFDCSRVIQVLMGARNLLMIVLNLLLIFLGKTRSSQREMQSQWPHQ